MRAYMEQHRAKALELVQAAAPGRTHEQHEAILERLRASVQEGRELICWLRRGALSIARVVHNCAAPHPFC